MYLSGLGLVLLVFAAVLLPSSGFATDRVVLPNWELLGTSPATANRILVTNSTETNLFPKEVRLIVTESAIDEIQAFYSDKIEIEQIAAAIDALYKGSEMADLHRKHFRLWKVSDKKFVIQLSDCEGSRLLIITRMKEPRKRASESVPHKQ
jgi:hypothetical protein